MKKKIGIITFHNAKNYGAVLQAYALQEKLISLGYNVQIINYQDDKLINDYKIGINLTNNILSNIKSIIKFLLFYFKDKKRENSFKQFIDNELILTTPIEKDNLKNLKNYNSLIVGSDQIWNTEITNGLSDIYTLNFDIDKCRKISYAASIGTKKINDRDKLQYYDKISKIDKISVREKSAKVELDKIIKNKNISVTLDPTFLLDKIFWESKTTKIINQKYILCYAIQNNPELIKIANELSKKTGLKIVYFERFNKYKSALKNAYTVGPFEFISLIKNAEYIISTSFHATTFSIIFNKKFWVIPHTTRGARMEDLLQLFDLNDRIITTLDEFQKVDYTKNIDYNIVNNKLKMEMKKSEQWLINAIEK